MGITDKFGNFQIKKSDRISKEDQAWLTHREELYKRAIAVYKSVYDIYKTENESYSEEDRKNYKYSSFLVGNFGVPKSLSDVQNSYISGIFSYFSNKYNVQLENNFDRYDLDREYYRYTDSEPIKELVIDFIDYHAVLDKIFDQLGGMSFEEKAIKELVVDFIDYHTVLDKIFDQLGGMSFEEKAIKEVKDKLKEKCYNGYHDTWEIKVKGNKFTYTGGYCSKETYFDYYNFGSTEWLRAFIDALAFNTYGEKTQVYSLNHLYGSYSIRLEEDDFQNGFSAPEVGVKHIKFFKNGRVDVTFVDAEFCRKFVREWCGYTLI